MRIWALALVVLFAFNLLAEAGSGHCKESFAPDAALTAGASIHAGGSQGGAEADSHACHLGHCGHILIAPPPAPKEVAVRPALLAAPGPARVWRVLSPLLRPPRA